MTIRRLTVVAFALGVFVAASTDSNGAAPDRSSVRDAAKRILDSPRFRNLKPLKRRPKMFRGDPNAPDQGPPDAGEFLDPNGNPVIVRDDQKRGEVWQDKEGKERAVIMRDADGREVILRDERNDKDVIIRGRFDKRVVRDEKGRPILFRDKDGNIRIDPDQRGRAVIGKDEQKRDIVLRDNRGREIIVRDVDRRRVLRRDREGRPVEIRDQFNRRVRIRDDDGNPIVRRDRFGRPVLFRDQNGRIEVRKDRNGRAIIGKDEFGRDIPARGQREREFVVRDPNDPKHVVRDDQGRPILRPDQFGRVPIERRDGRAVIGQDEEGRDVFLRDQRNRPILAREPWEMERLRQMPRQNFGDGNNFDPGKGNNGNNGDRGNNGGNFDGGGDRDFDPPDFDSGGSSSSPSSGGGAGGFFSAIAQVFGWIIVAIVACVMIFLIVQGVIGLLAWYRDKEEALPQPAQAAAAAEDPIQPDHSPGDLPADVYIAKSQELAAAGRFREAIAQLLLGGMSNLERSGLVKFRKGLTHRDYVRAIRSQPQFYQSMRAMVRLYEPLGFGRRTPSSEQYQQALLAYQAGFRATT